MIMSEDDDDPNVLDLDVDVIMDGGPQSTVCDVPPEEIPLKMPFLGFTRHRSF